MTISTLGRVLLFILVNDVPDTEWSNEALKANPFYSTYAIWETQVQVVKGTAFKAVIAEGKTAFSAGEQVTVKWGVNKNYFTEESLVRISMSTDYGKTFQYILADSVTARDGSCAVTLPNINIGWVEVDFTTAIRKMNGGVIKVEEIDGAAYTLTALDPNTDKGFTMTGKVDESEDDEGNNEEDKENGEDNTDNNTEDASCVGYSEFKNQKSELIYDLMGRRVTSSSKGIYLVNGKKVVK